nr:glycosyltransferase N-terminal domain-containing protein [Acetobacter fallax]
MRLHVLVSRNRDGQLMADVVAPWRFLAIHGSSDSKGKNKGGAAALRRIRTLLREGHVVAVMPDGPKGPRRQVQQGVLALAERAGVPVIPLGVMCRSFCVGSWDRMALPLPFGRGRIVCGAPVRIMRGEHEEARKTLTAALNAASLAAAKPVAGHVEYLRPMPASAVTEGVVMAPKMRGRAQNAGRSQLWAALATLMAPGLTVMLRVRLRRGKEIRERLRERMGLAPVSRPSGPLVWLHAASVGETVSVVPLIRACLEGQPSLKVLVTTGTVTAARTLDRELSLEMTAGHVLHQFVPLDVPRWIKRFLAQWQPACLVLTESEFWPNMIAACGAAGIPVAVVNGRISPRALAGWRRAPSVAKRVMGGLAWVAARSQEDAARFRALGASQVFCDGDLKMAAAPLTSDPALLSRTREVLAGRPVWVAASTHTGEEEAVFAAAALLRARIPDLLTIVAPRHPDRGGDVARLAVKAGLANNSVPRRSGGAWPASDDSVWIIDTLGELGMLFRLTRVVFMGNSLFPKPGASKGGGHNPFEPARSGCAIATGPQTGNFEEAFTALGDAVTVVHTAAELAAWAGTMLADPALARAIGEAGCAVATRDTALPGRLAGLIQAMVYND